MKFHNDIQDYILQHMEWSSRAFGLRKDTDAQKLVNHIRKELDEVLANPTDVMEWVDIIILAIDGAWRSGATSLEIMDALHLKQRMNRDRKWIIPEDPTQPNEHDRTMDERESNP